MAWSSQPSDFFLLLLDWQGKEKKKGRKQA
jgi:hypothetical protein